MEGVEGKVHVKFWGIYRAMVQVNRIRHRGVVAIECAFIKGTNVVLQSQFIKAVTCDIGAKINQKNQRLLHFLK